MIVNIGRSEFASVVYGNSGEMRLPLLVSVFPTSIELS